MLVIKLGNVYARCDGSPAELAVVSRALTVEAPHARFSQAFKRGLWDGTYHLFHRVSRTFPAGLVELVRPTLHHDHGMRTLVKDERTPPPTRELAPALAGITLRPDQREDSDVALKATRGVLRLATNYGKTVLAADLIRRLGVPTLFLVHRKELLEQTFDRFLEWFPDAPAAMMGAKHIVEVDEIYGAPVTVVAMVQALWALAKRDSQALDQFLLRYQCVFCDEAHHASADTFYKILMRCRNAYWRYGLSGTPLGLSEIQDLKLIGATGPVICDRGNAEMVERGVSAKPTVTMVAVPSVLDFPRRHSYQAAYGENVEQNGHDAPIIRRLLERHPGKRALIVVERIAHGTRLAEMLYAPFSSGEETDERRRELYDGFRAGKIPTLVASLIYKEGVDLPSMDVFVNASCRKSSVTTLQLLGRALRSRPDKTTVPVYDLAYEGSRYLDAHNAQRRADYEAEGFEVRDA